MRNKFRQAQALSEETLLGLAQGWRLDLAGRLGLEARDTQSYIGLRLAEIAFGEGERLLARYGRLRLSLTDEPEQVADPLDGAAQDRPDLDQVVEQFDRAKAQYEAVQQRTQDPYWRFLATANRARAMAQAFLVEGFLDEQPPDPLSLKQGLVRTLRSAQDALDTLYTEQLRVSSSEEKNLVLLIETLTRFDDTPRSQTEERRRFEEMFRDVAFSPKVATLGEYLRVEDVEELSSREKDTMQEFLLNPGNTAQRRDTERPTDGADTGLGSAEAGSRGRLH